MMTVSQTCPVQILIYFNWKDVFLTFSCIDLAVVQVNFTVSRAISVTEGAVVRLSGEAFGIYANEIVIGVECSETTSTGTDVEPGVDTIPGTDASMLLVGVV